MSFQRRGSSLVATRRGDPGCGSLVRGRRSPGLALPPAGRLRAPGTDHGRATRPPRFCTYRTLTMLCCSTDAEKPRKGTRGGGRRRTPRLLRRRAGIARRRRAWGARLSRGTRRGRSRILERFLSGFSTLTAQNFARVIGEAYRAPGLQVLTDRLEATGQEREEGSQARLDRARVAAEPRGRARWASRPCC